MLIPSTEYLTATQTAARLGVKAQTLYAYVSRGQLPRHRASDGRTSLFAVADVAKLERRRSARNRAPADVTVGSELTLVDKTDGRLWYRGLDVLEICTERRFEEVAGWLWTGTFDRMPPWRPDARQRAAALRVQQALPESAPAAERLPLVASAIAAHAEPGTETTTAARVLGCLVDTLPGAAARSRTFADRLATKLGAETPLPYTLDATLSLVCEHGLTYPTLAVRLTVAAGGGIEHAVASGMHASAGAVSPIASLERAFDVASFEGTMRAADSLDAAAIEAASWKEPYRSGDPRGAVIMRLLRDASPGAADTVDALSAELVHRGAPPPTAAYAVAAVAWACGMPPGSAAPILLISRTVGWIAHAIEEHRRPTPYRPRLAYTGQPPGTAAPRRTLDAVQGYLAGPQAR